MYRRQFLDHLGLVAGMFDERDLDGILDHATPPNPDMRDLTVGEAVKAMVLNGLGVINQALSLVPRFFQKKPTARLLAPRMAPAPLHDAALGRALDPLYHDGVTALYRLIAATAATRLGLRPTDRPLDRTRFHGAGRSHSDEPPAAQSVHITQGDSRAHRPDLHPGVWAWIVEPQAWV